jgi:hypothetical protein
MQTAERTTAPDPRPSLSELPQTVPANAVDAILIARYHQSKRFLVFMVRAGLILVALGVVMVAALAIATMGKETEAGGEVAIFFAGLFAVLIGLVMFASGAIGRVMLPRSVVARELRSRYPDHIA